MTLAIQQYLADVGIEIEIETMEGATVMEYMGEGEFDMGIIGYGTMSLLPDSAMNYIGADAVPPEGSNYSHYVDQELTDVLAEAAEQTDPEKRTELFYQVTEMSTDRLPLLPLVVQQDVLAINTDRVQLPSLQTVPRNRPGPELAFITWDIINWDIVQ